MAEQRAHCRAAQHAESLQLRPPALNQVLLHVLGVREGRVEENQQVVSQDGAAHISTIRTAVAGDALVESVGRHTHKQTHTYSFFLLLQCFKNFLKTQKSIPATFRTCSLLSTSQAAVAPSLKLASFYLPAIVRLFSLARSSFLSGLNKLGHYIIIWFLNPHQLLLFHVQVLA